MADVHLTKATTTTTTMDDLHLTKATTTTTTMADLHLTKATTTTTTTTMADLHLSPTLREMFCSRLVQTNQPVARRMLVGFRGDAQSTIS
eukprot:gene5682-7249_t